MDTPAAAQKARAAIAGHGRIAVDCEGDLRAGGRLCLVQVLSFECIATFAFESARNGYS